MAVSKYNKEAIIDAAARIFKRYGFEKTSISDITAALGKGRTSVYNHFKNKEEIFRAVVENGTGAYFGALQNMLLANNSAAKRLSLFCNIKFTFINSVQREFMLLQESIIQNSFLKTTLSQSTAAKEIKIIESILHIGMRSGEFTQMPARQVKLTASLFQTTITAVLANLYEKNDTKNFITARKIVEGMFINSLVNKASQL